MFSRLSVLEGLLNKCDVWLQTESNHDTALTLACAGGHEELVSVLIARGANIEHRDKKGTDLQHMRAHIHAHTNMHARALMLTRA